MTIDTSDFTPSYHYRIIRVHLLCHFHKDQSGRNRETIPIDVIKENVTAQQSLKRFYQVKS
ncbi:hypothetical protein [Bartonella refiksaydamii]|uniref:hypothetical protein n=1 Tax=Bartonella refiksaydamii TaxID=2654951 RepID=UPI0012EB1203|nr:hypothetical protein [Bartonella refiksaydamii]